MAIKSIVEMKAKPGRRDELLSTLQQMSAGDAPGFIAAEHYRNVEDEDTVIGIYDWKSNEERLAWSQSLDPGTREQLMDCSQRRCASSWQTPFGKAPRMGDSMQTTRRTGVPARSTSNLRFTRGGEAVGVRVPPPKLPDLHVRALNSRRRDPDCEPPEEPAPSLQGSRAGSSFESRERKEDRDASERTGVARCGRSADAGRHGGVPKLIHRRRHSPHRG